MTPEGRVKTKGRKIVAAHGIYQFPVQQGGTSRAGIPDDVLCVDGYFVTIEYKYHMDWFSRTKTALKTLPTMKQCIEMERIRLSGGFPFVVDEKSIDQLDILLTEFKKALSKQLFFGTHTMAWHWSARDYRIYCDGKGRLVEEEPFLYVPRLAYGAYNE